VDRGNNCYNCGGFSYITKHCKSLGIVGQERRIKYENNCNTMDNLKEKEILVVENLVVLN